MANKKAKPVVGIEYVNNDLAKIFVPLYKKWFGTFQKTPSYQNICGTLFQRHVTNNRNIPFLEVSSSFHKRNQPGHRLILFVNCNPSGNDVDYYAANNPNQEDFCYYNLQDQLQKAASDFVHVLNLPDVEFAMADVFPIVRSAQDDLKDAWKNKNVELSPLIELFKRVVCEIQPTVIVAINAFVSGLFKDGFLSDNSSRPLTLVNDSYYDLSYNTSFNTVAFCGGMLTGQHAMDIHSRMRLIRDVRDYLISH